VLVLKACFEQVKLIGEGDAQNAQHIRDLFSNIFRHLLDKPCFSTNFCQALKTVPTNEQFLHDLSTAFKLSGPEKSAVGLALLDSGNLDLRLRGKETKVILVSGREASIPILSIEPLSSFNYLQRMSF
jgi:CCR4-NOT transcription complex subunit 1